MAPTRIDPAGDGPVLRYRTMAGGLRIAVHDWGNADAPALLLIHGGRDHARSWDRVARRLRDRFHVLAIDLRGHGDSEWQAEGRYPMEDYVLDVATLIEQERLAPLAIIGHSLGGNIAIRYTGSFPDKVTKLVAIEGLGPSPALWAERTAQPPGERMRIWIEQVFKTNTGQPRALADLAEATDRMRAAHPTLDAAMIAHLVRYGTRAAPGGGLAWKHDRRMMILNPADLGVDQQHALWRAIACQTLLLYGTASWASNPLRDGRAAEMPAARVELVEGAGHWIQHDRFDDFIERVERFL